MKPFATQRCDFIEPYGQVAPSFPFMICKYGQFQATGLNAEKKTADCPGSHPLILRGFHRAGLTGYQVSQPIGALVTGLPGVDKRLY
jgi:hypothetical protein